MKVSCTADGILLAENSKEITRSETKDIRACNATVIEETMQIARFLKATKRNLAIGQDRMYAIRDEHSNMTQNLDEILQVEDRLYISQYTSCVRQGGTT